MRLDRWEGLKLNDQDTAQRFAGTYMYGSLQKDKPRTYFLECTGDFDYDFYWNDDSPKQNCRRLHIGEFDCERWFPETGVVPWQNTVLFLRRVPNRQWKVGLCGDNARLWNSDLKRITVRLDQATALYESVAKPISIEDIHARFSAEKKLNAIALTRKYWIARSQKELKLYRNTTMLGSFVMGKFFIHGTCHDLKQELWDDLHLKVT